MSTYLLCDPIAILPAPEGVDESPWRVLVEVPSNHPTQFIATVRLASVQALGNRLGDGLYQEAFHRLAIEPERLPIELVDEELTRFRSEDGIWNGLRYWFVARDNPRLV